MNVIALLPYLVEHFEEPNTTCSEVAEHIAQVIIVYSKFSYFVVENHDSLKRL